MCFNMGGGLPFKLLAFDHFQYNRGAAFETFLFVPPWQVTGPCTTARRQTGNLVLDQIQCEAVSKRNVITVLWGGLNY